MLGYKDAVLLGPVVLWNSRTTIVELPTSMDIVGFAQGTIWCWGILTGVDCMHAPEPLYYLPPLFCLFILVSGPCLVVLLVLPMIRAAWWTMGYWVQFKGVLYVRHVLSPLSYLFEPWLRFYRTPGGLCILT